jgi:hypothetical protein
VPSVVVGQEKSAPTTTGADRLRLGFIGIGKMSSGHHGFFTGRTDCEVLAICDVDKFRREHFVKQTDDKYKELKRANYPAARGTSITRNCWPTRTSTRS